MWCVFIKWHQVKKLIRNLPQRPLTEIDLWKYVKRWKIGKFRGIFSRDVLPGVVHRVEKGIVNLDDDDGEGTHWVAYKKNKDVIKYFDSYGDLRPPIEVEKYLLSNGDGVIQYNYKRYQDGNSVNCGQLSLLFLRGWIK